MVSPGLAGVVDPGYRLPGPSRVPLACVAATYFPPLNTKNDGESACACAVKLVLAAPLLVTTTCTGPLIASGGVRTLICVDRKSTRLNSSHLGISYAVF